MNRKSNNPNNLLLSDEGGRWTDCVSYRETSLHYSYVQMFNCTHSPFSCQVLYVLCTYPGTFFTSTPHPSFYVCLLSSQASIFWDWERVLEGVSHLWMSLIMQRADDQSQMWHVELRSPAGRPPHAQTLSPFQFELKCCVFLSAGGRVKTWKRRWFILTDNCLYYFEYTTVS